MYGIPDPHFIESVKKSREKSRLESSCPCARKLLNGMPKVYTIQVGLKNNFRLAGWNLGSSCI